MNARHKQGAASAAPTFDASAWLAAYVEAGGAFVLSLSGGPIFLVADVEGFALTHAMSQIVGKPDRLLAVRDAMEAR